MARDEAIDISEFSGAGDGGTTEQLRYFASCVEEDKPIGLPAANLDEAIKTMAVAEQTLHATQDGLDSQLQEAVAAAEKQAASAWRAVEAEVPVARL
eukprot:SAG22_NODE_2009_length_3150_cov_3.039331_3_plen_97_part_00